MQVGQYYTSDREIAGRPKQEMITLRPIFCISRILSILWKQKTDIIYANQRNFIGADIATGSKKLHNFSNKKSFHEIANEKSDYSKWLEKKQTNNLSMLRNNADSATEWQ